MSGWIAWLLFGLLGGLAALALTAWTVIFYRVKRNLLPRILRIFQEKPLFIIPRGQPVDDAENVTFKAADGLNLAGSYFRTCRPRRKGVILFGLEFGSNRWACLPYCQFLRDAGFDVFTFESRCQGDSDGHPGYEPLQWVTMHEVRDLLAAAAYLKARPDADPRGVGFFGISKGASAGLFAAARDPYLRCVVTDGAFGIHSTMVPYMRKWIGLYNRYVWLHRLAPDWYYRMFADMAVRRVGRERSCEFVHLERALPRLGRKPLLMIHGGADTYIRPEMARSLFRRARGPKEFWVVPGAKHNQSLPTATAEYQRRVLEFFETHLTEPPREPARAGPPPARPAEAGHGGRAELTPCRE